MPHVGMRTVAVAAAAGALWLGLGAAARASETVLETRIPYVPAEVLPPVVIPGDPASAVTVELDPGDNDRPDPAPKLIITLRG